MDGYYEQRDIKKKKMKKCGTLEMAIRMEIPNVYLLFTFSSSPFSFIYVSPSHSSHTINGKYTFGISILIAISNVPHFFIFFLFISLFPFQLFCFSLFFSFYSFITLPSAIFPYSTFLLYYPLFPFILLLLPSAIFPYSTFLLYYPLFPFILCLLF